MNVKLSEDQRIEISGSDSLYPVMKEILLRDNEIDQDREHLWVAGFAANHILEYIELVSLGSQTKAIVEPMEVFSWALQKRCSKIIMVHNHPSGILSPSPNDKDITDRMIQVGIIVDVEVLDHQIISPKGYYSFADYGLMQELAKSLKYVPPYVIAERMKKEAVKIAEKAARKDALLEKQWEIARKLKSEGMDADFIKKVTGVAKKYFGEL